MPTCSDSSSAIHELNPNVPIHPSIATFLVPHQVLSNQLASAWAFQFEQMSLRISHLRKRGDLQRQTLENLVPQIQILKSLRTELAELKVVNHQLQAELEDARSALSHRQQASVSNQTSTISREARPQQSSSRPVQNSAHKRTASMGQNLEERPSVKFKQGCVFASTQF